MTLLELEAGDITVKSHSGKMHLGGEDFDNRILQYCINLFKCKTSIDLNEPEFLKAKTRLKEHCEKAKKELSFVKEIEIEVESIAKGKDFYYKLTRAKFEELCKDLFEICKNPINEVLKDSNCCSQDVDEIVLVGGSTKIPKIQEILSEYFNGKELNKKLNSDEAIAYGATIEAALQMGKYSEDVALLDVCPFSLGIAVANQKNQKLEDMHMSKIIERGTKLPCKKTKTFIPSEDYMTSIIYRVYEGENQYIRNNYPLGKFRLINLPKKPRKEVVMEVTFDLDEDSILTVTAVEKNNKSNMNSIVIKNDKGGLSKNEIEKAQLIQNNETLGNDLEPAIILERNYKKEINKLYNQINTLTNPQEQFLCIRQLQNCIENLINSFNKDNMENETYKQKMYYYLIYLFNCYSTLLNFKELLSYEEKDDIIFKIKNYLEIFAKNGTSYGLSLINIFKNNENDIFGDFCIQILGYYSQRGTVYYSNNEKKNSKHYFEEALSIINKYSIKEKVKDNSYLLDKFVSINNNIKELLNILKAESLEKYCVSFSKDILIREDEFSTKEKKIDILDRFKDALSFLKNPHKRADKLLKAIYLANIVKIEYKMFNSNNYEALLKMIEACINLKLDVPQGCGRGNNDPQLAWFKEICDIKLEIESKNPDDIDVVKNIKEKLKNILDEINDYYKKGKIEFLFYILKNQKPIGLDKSFMFETKQKLEDAYNANPKNFMKKMRRLYNPLRYKGDKEEEQHTKMQEIQKLLNELE